MELLRKNKLYFAICVTSLFSSLVFYFIHRYRKSLLPKALLQRLLTVKSMYETSKILNVEICFTIENILLDIADFFYFRDHSELESIRTDLLDIHDDEYEEICLETLRLQNECVDKAQRYIHSYTAINYKDVKDFLDKNRLRYLELKNKYRTKAENIPKIDKNLTKEAYIFYSDNIEKAQSLGAMMGNIRNPQEQHELYKSMIIQTFQVKDRLQHKFKIDERFLPDLLDIHNLRDDEEIKLRLNKLKNLDEVGFHNAKKQNEEQGAEN